ncbi:MAG: hypothetical protein ACK2UC_01355 [Anaerolineae bacterium]|jgi:hypothetical protein
MDEPKDYIEGYRELLTVDRAWMMVRSETGDASNVAQAIYDLNDKLPWPWRRIVRADVVEGGFGLELDFDIMVPVWAEGPNGIEAILGLIQGLGTRVIGIALVPGTEGIQYPYPPHRAWGILPRTEASREARPMGFNPWG